MISAPTSVLAAESPLGDGRIDNWIIPSSVHVTLGIAVLVVVGAAVVWLGRRAVAGLTIDPVGKALVGASQVVLALQVLLGIKLLDQGQGISQLYIHYLGGMAPMAVFLVAGWWIRGETPKSNRLLAALVALGWISAVMAFTIGRAYVNR